MPAPRGRTQITETKLVSIRHMLDAGHSFAEIQKRLHVSPSTLYRYFPGRAWSREKVGKHTQKLLKEGNTQ